MRPTLEFEILNHPEHKVIAIVPDGKEYLIHLNGKIHYGGTKFTLNDAKEKIDFLRKYLNITSTPVERTQDGQAVPTKRKRRTKAEMQAARREMEHAKRKRTRVNSAIAKKPRGRASASKRNRRNSH